jgi:hypothetical protein
MPIRTFVDGDRPSSADFNRYFMQQDFVVKPVNESVTNNAVTQADDHLFFPVLANTDYWVLGLIFYDADSGVDFKMAWNTLPSGSTFSWGFDGVPNIATSFVGNVSRSVNTIASSPPTAGGIGVGSVGTCIVKGLLRVGSANGTLAYRWCQGTAGPTAVTCRAGSTLIVRRLTS